ncbi:hypothetical protein SAMN02799624_02154 [Paenibacillus sp. UNC496MF]|uniref:hypothetical protein n=1 Tax=Paenibacillus sp. UNC496MF TaxID=1502753 RepID=UPI0008E3C700|nr:hypothetical protein [Paenibacillus sp. UNC496MF]SFI78147.1 hypothetical protein SAMN02799624_02154 [Paenibacillus sp. UNC496MF]
MSARGDEEAVSLYLLAGLATAPQFMESFRGALHAILEREGFTVRTSQLLFPYGDWSRRAVPQLWEIGRDMRLAPGRIIGRSIGGRRAVDAIGAGWRPEPGKAGRIALIGHSGGGVAAVHAAWMLHDLLGGPPSPVVMIGSPRCRIPAAMRASTLFAYAGGAEGAAAGRRADGVSRLGTFGGWRRDKHAPGERREVPIIGKHADYFREREPFINELGLTNLRLTLSVVWPWLRERI